MEPFICIERFVLMLTYDVYLHYMPFDFLRLLLILYMLVSLLLCIFRLLEMI